MLPSGGKTRRDSRRALRTDRGTSRRLGSTPGRRDGRTLTRAFRKTCLHDHQRSRIVPQELEVARPANGGQDRAHDPPDRDARGAEQGDALLPQQPGGRRRAPRGSSPEPLVSGEHLPLRARRDLRRRRLAGPRERNAAHNLRELRAKVLLDHPEKKSMRAKRKLAALDPAFRFSLLSIIPLVSHA
ncbi:MAG: hypothetical protein ACI8T1_002596 [Verrucomicrobiales bacterium]